MWIDLKHLKKADQKYLPHAFRVILVSINLLWLSLAGFIHAIFPFILFNTVSDGIKKISNQMIKYTRL
jgi:hypothetical protein